ncbi:MAG: hypothetical protein A3D31_16885 [Candidatus Fluviicola riflensis]|nr:MAG: hypothetical protein CHH17_01825 [Candidatus Fluviicola riflensis]OGS76667.1 MAG: hypothetical protein A3D31_16885 [Candidatus Fluviicola riflensis]OGS82978.1 MAG: hypothetical protein A2724_14475 [Fluviicola sp. RIFCSPHIGHO2_01_FULL_43_53]OGS88398.1 MAG: hypothetical protein A3E30_06390 [Fluviicola sp. RIFCSPHIGHO2_12_FULL_43_24]
MSRFQAIENTLKAINGTVFQELCDSYLKLRNPNFLAFSRTGSQVGKQKTTKGTPDSFFLLPNGNYLFVEITTDISTKDKLSNDILACFDFNKTKIPINKVEEIILCFNWNIDQKEILKLNTVVKRYNNNTTVRYLMLQELAIELHLNHRDLTHEYLGLPLDTGQIVSIEKFIEEYNRASRGISTPLDNTFLHRERELKELKDTILQNDFVILTGAPGIGKTKLAIEGIKSFLSENLNFSAYCVSYKNNTLLDDLFQYFDSEKDYILFVDDANRIDAFSQITGFYKATRKGKLKVLITVRDYAFQDIGILCQEFAPKRLDLLKFTDEQVIDIIKAKPFDILHSQFHKEIIRIADGNPRLAIMTALLAKEHQDINALHDVSDLFEKYFSTFIKDDGEFSKLLNIQCLGLIAFFFTIPYKNKEITSQILNHFGIDYSAFIDVIDKLDKLELIEIQFEHVKIPEQNLSTYFFYKAFIKDGLLSFETLLNNYFESNTNRFKDCVIPANNTFGSQNVMDKLRPFLQSFWGTIKTDNEKAFKFLSTFWFYLINETLEFIYSLVQSLPTVSNPIYKVTYENNAFSYDKNNVVELVGEFFRFPNNLKDAVGLAFEYARKNPNDLPELIHKIREQMLFDFEDERIRFIRQVVLFQILIDGLNKKDDLFSISFYELAKTFLSFKFHQAKGGRNHSFYWYDYPVPNSQPIQLFRKQIWEALETNFENYPINSFELLQSYSCVRPDVSKEVMEFDIPFLRAIIEKYLTPNSFEHCRYVQDQIRWCKRNSATHPWFEFLATKFTNPTYETFLKIDWDRFRDKEMYEFDNHDEYQKLKETEIRTAFVFSNSEEVKKFYEIFVYLKNLANNDWGYGQTLEYVVDENCTKNFDLGCQLLRLIIEKNNEVNHIPRMVFRNHLNTKEKAAKIWNIIQSGSSNQNSLNGIANNAKQFWKILTEQKFNFSEVWKKWKVLKRQSFNHKELWELSFYDYIADDLLSKEYVQALVDTISSMTNANTIHFDRLQRFLKFEPNLFQIILRKIVEKNEKEGTRLQVWMDFFSEHFERLGNDVELIKKAYLQQGKIHNHFDYQGKGFLNILKKDSNFIYEYVSDLYSVKHFGLSGSHKDLSFVWKIENIEPVLVKVFELILEREDYFGISDHFCNSFFRNLQGDEKERAKIFLLEYCKFNNADSNKMNIVVDIARHSMRELFEEILFLFLTLNQDRETFSKIWWRGNGTSGSGNVILSDIEAADWKNILSIVERSDAGIKLLPIKQYLNERVESCLRSGDRERLWRFTEQH